jgi:hypothetical protein
MLRPASSFWAEDWEITFGGPVADQRRMAARSGRLALTDRRRRLASLAVFVVAAAAVIATTPPIATSELTASGSASVDISTDRPAVRGQLRVDITAAALPTSSGVSASGSVEIRIHPSGAAVTLVPSGAAPAVLVRNGSAWVDIGQACTLGRHCALAYDVLVEPLVPPASSANPTVRPANSGPDGSPNSGSKTTTTVGVDVRASIRYSGRDLVPPDARITIEGLDAFVAVMPAAGLDAQIGEDEVVVGPAHPIAIRELELELSAAAIPRPIVAPLSGTLDVQTQRLDASDGSSDSVVVDVVPEETLDEPASVLPRAAALPVEPFATCLAKQTCRRRVMLVFEWFAQAPAKDLRVRWDASVHVRYAGMDSLGPDAALAIRTVDSRSAGDGGAMVSVEGDLTVSGTTAKYGTSVGKGFTLATDARTLDATDLRGVAPPGVGLVDATVRTADGRPVPGNVIDEIHLSGPSGTVANGYPLYGQPVINGPPVRLAFQPLRICESGQPCKVEFQVGMTVPGENQMPVGIPLIAEFHVAISLPYLSLEKPPDGAALHLDIVP